MHSGGLRWASAENRADFLRGEDREKWLASLCLDPATNLELQIDLPKIKQLMADLHTGQKGGVTVTKPDA